MADQTRRRFLGGLAIGAGLAATTDPIRAAVDFVTQDPWAGKCPTLEKFHYDGPLPGSEERLREVFQVLQRVPPDMKREKFYTTVHQAVTSELAFNTESPNSRNLPLGLLHNMGRCMDLSSLAKSSCDAQGAPTDIVLVPGHALNYDPERRKYWDPSTGEIFTHGEIVRAFNIAPEAVEQGYVLTPLTPNMHRGILIHNTAAEFLTHGGELEGIEEIEKEALAYFPKLAGGRRLLSHIYILQGKGEAAEAELEQTLAINPNDTHAHGLMGDIKMGQGLLKQAEAAYTRALKTIRSQQHSSLIPLFEARAYAREQQGGSGKLDRGRVKQIQNKGYLTGQYVSQLGFSPQEIIAIRAQEKASRFRRPYRQHTPSIHGGIAVQP